MKDLMKIKWEMHKGVNYIFYAFVIGIGLLIGLGIKKFVLPGINISIPSNISDLFSNLFT